MINILKTLLLFLFSGTLSAAVFPNLGWCDIFRYVDENGGIYFTNIPTVSHFEIYLKENADTPFSGSAVENIISRYSTIFDLEKALVKAVIKVESDYNPSAVSRKGALGYMQLLPETARDMNVGDPLDPTENIRGGSRYLRLMLDSFEGDLDLALAAYNAGPGTVRQYGGIPPFEETQNYILKIKKYLQFYRQSEDDFL